MNNYYQITINFQQRSPQIIFENNDIAVVFKPNGLASAPLAKKQNDNVLTWFLTQRPEAANVQNIKNTIEKGLLHRLDTPTTGLVLIAKTQHAFNSLFVAQQQGRIIKRYRAGVVPTTEVQNALSKISFPHTINSRFRGYGKGQKKVQVVTPTMFKYKNAQREYQTQILSYEKKNKHYFFLCQLNRGYRHQIRAHLAFLGCPIAADLLYNPTYALTLTADKRTMFETSHNYPLELYATEIQLSTGLQSTPALSIAIDAE